ncbi:hypothetical protein BDU57DRAFT_540965 [Ampelomyces quisqualis]|uniref:Uncharacterized protein n=1 Tax=Ampelomyces quisqualis TaxID=50730 RepID=A0A6A5QD80_AMPQU|nr:hypothetical protein BDU57DRAFT_540965 [Ampelomyces quisqualis]
MSSPPPQFTQPAGQPAYEDFDDEFPYHEFLNTEPGDDVFLNTEPGNDVFLNTEPDNDEFLNTEPGDDVFLNTEPDNDEFLNTEPGDDEFLNVEPGDDSAFQDLTFFDANGFQFTADDLLNFDGNMLSGDYDDTELQLDGNALLDWNSSETLIESQQELEHTTGQEDTTSDTDDEAHPVPDPSSNTVVQSTSRSISQQDGSSRAQVQTPAPNPDLEALREHVPILINSPILTQDQKTAILSSLPEAVLNDLYSNVTIPGFAFVSSPSGMTESSYRPLIKHNEVSFSPSGPTPSYPLYSAKFRTTEQARRYRKRSRVAPKDQAPDLHRVRKYGRHYWVQELYNAMIDVSQISDGASSIHRTRFTTLNPDKKFDALDLEATAHHIFDMALSVHERGWTRPKIYHKKAVRGKLVDVSEKSIEARLSQICDCLRQKKAVVDDAVRGGVTLALLCDNPEARSFTKNSNNAGNKKRGERLKLVKKIQARKNKKNAKGKKKEQNEQELEQLELELAQMSSDDDDDESVDESE